MGILKRLFGGRDSGEEAPPPAVEYNGYRIRAEPFEADGGEYQTAGVIEKDFPEGAKTHHFIRAERHASAEEAATFALAKGRQIVDQRGDKMFDSE